MDSKRIGGGIFVMGAFLLMLSACEKVRFEAREVVSVGGQEWMRWVPPDQNTHDGYIAPGCPKGAAPGVRISADDYSRFGIRPRTERLPVVPGDRYRFSAWVRAEPDFRVKEGHAGVLLRMTFYGTPERPYRGGHVYLGAKGAVLGKPERLAGSVPKEWHLITGVIQIPPDVAEMRCFVLCQYGKGSFCVAEPRLEKVTASMPLSAFIAEPQS